MADLTTEQKVFLIEKYYTSGKSKTAARRALQTKYPDESLMSESTISRVIDRFLAHGTLHDRREDNEGRPNEVTTPESLDQIEAYFTANPHASIRHASQELGINRESMRLILRRFLKWHPYKIWIGQALTQEAMTKRVAFCAQMGEVGRTGVIQANKIILSDEAHFHLDGYVNKQNFRHWGKENPQALDSQPLHPQRLTA
ncbi:uncharacterized protein LOC128385843 [Panonychus citri]|uniref:uncharacterized protein LOC128385843 n=1 Tax=Panonychus citri TaxID=50023 RepID=UPI002307095D|nr:uncharacterized protein LOC128385843 [Panonychus citri]